ncbi:MAG: hypothetical protein ACON4Z_17270, partial [Planctomycetota bacterium]
MDEHEVEVSFCEICGASVPAGDLDAGHARRAHGKTVGRCCVAALVDAGASTSPSPGTVAAGSAADKPGEAAAADRAAAEGRSESARLLPLALCVLVAVLGGTFYLDGRLSAVGGAVTDAQSGVAARQRADSEVLQNLDLKLEDAPVAADVRALTARLEALAAAQDEQQEAARRRQDLLDQEIDGLRRALRAAEERIVDYRPLFEDLRQRHTRALAVLEGLRDRPSGGAPVAA